MTFQFIPGAPDDIAQITDQAALRHFVDHADPRAFEVLTLRYQGMVLATCRRVLGATAEADDAVQETFFRLARHAKEIRSNVAAWLHACAFRTSIDLQRREGARRRAEATAAQQGADDDTLATWRELEPLIDEALNKLHESDRELIVSRFLVGRPQTEMAAEAGVNPGTMHRRIDAALERLREHLRTGGVVLGAGAFVAALTHAPAPAQASVTLAGSLGKIALAQSAGSATATGAAAGGVSWVAVALVGLTLSGGATAVMMSRSHNAAPSPPPPPPPAAAAPANQASVLADKGTSFARPSREISGYTLMENYSETMTMPRLYFDGDKLYFGPDATSKRSMGGAVLRITAIDPAAKPPTITFKGESVEGEVGKKAEDLIGQEINATYRLEPAGGREGGAMVMTGKFGADRHPSDNRAVRLAPGSPLNKQGNPKGNDPALAGSWMIVNNQELKLTQDEITFEDKPSHQPVERYRIIEWTESEAAGYAKVQTICTAFGPARGAVGKRFKFLVRKEDKGYTFLSYDADSDKRDTWPERFDYAPEKQLRAYVFRKD